MITEEYRGYRIVHDPLTKYEIKNIGKGGFPVFLKGYFTSVGAARQHIDVYFTWKEDKYGKGKE